VRDDRRERRAQVVRDVRQELRFQCVARLQLRIDLCGLVQRFFEQRDTVLGRGR